MPSIDSHSMVSDQTLVSDVFSAVRTVLVNASLATTTQTNPQTIATASIGASYNDKTPARPQVIIQPASVSEAEYKFGSRRGRQFINVVVGVYGPTTLAVDQLQDQTVYAVSENVFDGMELVGYTSDYSYFQLGENKYHTKTIVFNFDRD